MELSWFGSSVAGGTATVYRRTAETIWTVVASLGGDVTGTFRFVVDTNVRPGGRYGYRIGVREGTLETLYGETPKSRMRDEIVTDSLEEAREPRRQDM